MTYHASTTVHILATNCCVCGRDLMDAKSVELGIGPVCRSRYMRDDPIPLGENGWARALGTLAQLGFPQQIVDGVMKRRPDTRKVANLIVHWASANYQDRQVVLNCAKIVRHLGYIELADKLEKDRSDVRLVETEGGYEVYCKRNNLLDRYAYRIGSRVRHASGRFKCWSFPTKSKRALDALLGYVFGGKRLFVKGGSQVLPKKSLSDFFNIIRPPAPPTTAPAPAPPQTSGAVTMIDKGRYFIIDAPYNAAFVADIRGIRGRRYEGGGRNSFPNDALGQVRQLVQQHYGATV